MNISVNGQPYSLSQEQTLWELLVHLQLAERPCAVALNEQVIPRSRLQATLLKAGDAIELVQAVGGG